MKRSKKINIKLYQCKVHFIYTDNLSKEYLKLHKKYKEVPEEPAENGEAWTLTFSIEDYYILIREGDESVNTIAHEVYHAVYNILDDRGINDEESGAWMCGMLIEEAFKFYYKNKDNGIHRQICKAEDNVGGAGRDSADNKRVHQSDDDRCVYGRDGDL